jgi:four helix bundle protein
MVMDHLMTHKDLEVWKKSIELVKETYKATSTFPKEEIYALTSQMRRSVVSIPSNIAEGATRQSNKEFIQFLFIALGSTSELETQFIISKELHYIGESAYCDLTAKIEEISKMLNGLIKYRKSKERN